MVAGSFSATGPFHSCSVIAPIFSATTTTIRSRRGGGPSQMLRSSHRNASQCEGGTPRLIVHLHSVEQSPLSRACASYLIGQITRSCVGEAECQLSVLEQNPGCAAQPCGEDGLSSSSLSCGHLQQECISRRPVDHHPNVYMTS